MRMVWPLPEHDPRSDRPAAPAPGDSSAALPALPASARSDATMPPSPLRRVAAIVSSDLNESKVPDGGPGIVDLAGLAETGLLQIDTFTTRFDGAEAATGVAAAFAQVDLLHRRQPFDAILVIGCGTVEPDVGMLHTVLAPCIATAGIPVLTAVGSDDANTILGDVAQQVFANPASLLAAVAMRLSRVPIPADEAILRIRSLAAFLLTEMTVASRILLDASVRPALLQHLALHADALERWRLHSIDVRSSLEQRVAREIATLDDLRLYIDQQLAQHTEQRRLRSRRSLLRLRSLAVLAYAAFVGSLSVSVTIQQTVFFSGCALVLLSALYTALADRILGDIDAIPVQTGIVRSRLKRQAALHHAAATSRPHLDSSGSPDADGAAGAPSTSSFPTRASRPFSGALMNDQSNEHVHRAYRDAADENLLLGTILQRLEQSDHLSLDELDAIILQADAAYKTRLARLEHTRAMIAGLGTPGETQ